MGNISWGCCCCWCRDWDASRGEPTRDGSRDCRRCLSDSGLGGCATAALTAAARGGCRGRALASLLSLLDRVEVVDGGEFIELDNATFGEAERGVDLNGRRTDGMPPVPRAVAGGCPVVVVLMVVVPAVPSAPRDATAPPAALGGDPVARNASRGIEDRGLGDVGMDISIFMYI